MEYQQAIETIYQKIKLIENKGQVANYIPELAKIDENLFGIHFAAVSGFNFGIGDYQKRFSIQSIAKVFSLCLAYKNLGESLWQRVGVEPSGTRFNSLVQLENDNGIPRNPFINAGAIVIIDVLMSLSQNPKQNLLEFINSLSEIKNISYSNIIAASEKSVGFRNVALCNFIKSFGNIVNEPNDVLDLYFDLCSIELNCEDLSKVFLFLANNGKTPDNKNQILTPSQTKRINALMQTCGLYDEAGEFTFRVGLPGKSGVGGGIIAIHPGKYTIAVWSPKLNDKGNSFRGIRFLEEFTTLTNQSIF